MTTDFFASIIKKPLHKVIPVTGGDINQSYRLYGEETSFFVKINYSMDYPGMMACEAAGLNALQESSAVHVPQVISHGITENYQFLALEWIEAKTPTNKTMEQMGASLARLHAQSQPFFGWEQDNYIGTLHQRNTPSNSWDTFYAEQRIIPLIEQLFNSHKIKPETILMAQRFCQNIKNIFPKEHSSLLHGDLWSGNFLIGHNEHPYFIDPSVYFGHREMDIAMTKLFGGFSNSFYEAYNHIYPLKKNWEHRLPFAQLYPLLVHANLFGGSYIAQVQQILVPFK